MAATILKGTGGPTLIFSGNLNEDKYGLSTGNARWWALKERDLVRVALIGSKHPVYSTLSCERRNLTPTDGGFFLDAGYSGVIGTPAPVFEIDTSTSQEPIETHPNFLTFAGNAGAPLNGAIFDESDGSFLKFGNSAPNEWRGVTSYMMPVVTARKTYISTQPPTDIASLVGKRQDPPFTTGVSVGNWLVATVSSDQRGKVYVVRVEWRHSGPKGWSTPLYGT